MWCLKARNRRLALFTRRTLVAAAVIAAVPVMVWATEVAHLTAPVSSGSANQPYAEKRPVTGADRDDVARYRSGRVSPVYSTDFANSAAMQREWVPQTDDSPDLQSCRRPANAVATADGLRLRTTVSTDCHDRWTTGAVVSSGRFGYGYFEASMKIADIKGMNNAFWLITQDHFEIDVAEAQFPDYVHLGVQDFPVSPDGRHLPHTGVGYGAHFAPPLWQGFHEYGLLWTPTELVYVLDGEPFAAFSTHGAIRGPADLRLSAALAKFAGGAPAKPEGHDVVVRSLRVFAE